MKYFIPLAVVSLVGLSSAALADDTYTVPQDFALQRVVELNVTPMGVVLDLGSSISAVNISHMRDIVFTGLDGALCSVEVDCSATQPTALLLRKIPPIDFDDREPSPDGTAMLFVNTDSGLYRFQLTPVSSQPDYTKVQIEPSPPHPPFPSTF